MKISVFRKFLKAYLLYLYYKNNEFAKELFNYCSFNKCLFVYSNVFKQYHGHIDEINDHLYKKLNAEDRNLFIRWLLKRYWNIKTYTQEEKRIIDKAFDEVEKLYKTADAMQGGGIEFMFLNHHIKFYHKLAKYPNHSSQAQRLMKYYLIAHAFFLMEYEMQGFNPENGQTIFDIGAASGDTALAFNTMYPNSKIFSFEYGDTFAELKQNIKLNNAINITPLQAFMYKNTGVYYLDKNYKIVNETDKNSAEQIRVDTLSIDDFVQKNKIDNVGLLKFDIEGGEYDTLQGALQTIKRFKPLIYLPIYHIPTDIYKLPILLDSLNMQYECRLKWTEKLVWGVDCVLFVRFK